MLADWEAGDRPVEGENVVERIESATAAELFELAESEWATDVVASLNDNDDGSEVA
jgi:hypothetical protein